MFGESTVEISALLWRHEHMNPLDRVVVSLDSVGVVDSEFRVVRRLNSLVDDAVADTK